VLKNEGENADAAAKERLSLLLSQPATTSTAAAAAAAAATASTLGLSAATSDAKKDTVAPHKHSKEPSQDLGNIKRAKKGDKENSLAETTSAAVAAALAAASNASAAAADDHNDGNAELLLALRSRIFSQQSPTEDTTPHGAAGRAERVASLRAAAVAAEVEFRRLRCSRIGSSATTPSALARSLFPPERLAPSHRDYVAICVVLKDQSVDLPEFVAWHAALGVETFYLYDHGSAPPVSALEAASMLPPATKGEVKIHVELLTEAHIAVHPSKIPQLAAYDSCVASHRAEHEWLAFFDVDEFVVISSNASFASSSASSSPASSPSSSTPFSAVPSFPLLLSNYEGAAAALALHWSMFGSGGRLSRKPDLALTAEAFEACLPRDNGNNRHIKTVAATRMLDVAEPCLGAHHFAYWDFEGAVAAEEEESDDDGVVAASASASDTISSRPSPPPPQPFAVDVQGDRIDGPYSRVAPGERAPKVPHAPAFLAHFVLKSKEEYAAKMLRGNAMKSNKGWSFFDEVDKMSTERCPEVAALAQKIKATNKI